MSTHKADEPNKDTPKWHKVWLALGGNVGDVKANMIQALSALDCHVSIKVEAVSDLYKTPPWGDENQDWFLNGCARIQTTLKPLALLKTVKAEEKNADRKKTRRWGPRTLDLDLLVFEGAILDSEQLTLPHPRMNERAFVLMPLCDFEPNLMLEGKTACQRLATLETQNIEALNLPKDWWRG